MGCDNVHIDCGATDLQYVEGRFTDGGVNLAPAKACLLKKCGKSDPTKTAPWTVGRLHSQYKNIFQTGNRNAASHLWFSFILKNAGIMPESEFLTLSSSFCPVSGSPLHQSLPADRVTYKTSLPLVMGGGAISGYMHFCCWPCACDTEEHIQVDTKTIETAAGSKQYFVAVIGDPCKNPSKVTSDFRIRAPEIECLDTADGGKLKGATYSDHGHIILSVFFTAQGTLGIGETSAVVKKQIVNPAHDAEVGTLKGSCANRAKAGHNSGMGTIFRELALMTPIKPQVPVKKTIVQTVTIASVVNADAYHADAKLKRACELGYGTALGIVSCAANSCSFDEGCSVSSQASRRAGATITFTATVAGRPTPEGEVLAANIAAGVAVVVAADTSISSVQVPAPGSVQQVSSQQRPQDAGDNNVGLIVGLVVATGVVVAIGVAVYKNTYHAPPRPDGAVSSAPTVVVVAPRNSPEVNDASSTDATPARETDEAKVSIVSTASEVELLHGVVPASAPLQLHAQAEV